MCPLVSQELLYIKLLKYTDPCKYLDCIELTEQAACLLVVDFNEWISCVK